MENIAKTLDSSHIPCRHFPLFIVFLIKTSQSPTCSIYDIKFPKSSKNIFLSTPLHSTQISALSLSDSLLSVYPELISL